jgi:acetyl/propionyl-CoA carboxylase alpha subunit
MADKGYTPASGESFEVRRAARGGFEVRKGADKPTQHEPSFELSRIDSRTQRALATTKLGRKLLWIYESKGKRILSWPGGSIELDASDLLEGKGGAGGKLRPLKLTMPGKVMAVKVKEGDIVEEGAGLLVVEAMKMENLLLAPARAKIAKLHVAMGDRLDSGSTLITFEAAE